MLITAVQQSDSVIHAMLCYAKPLQSCLTLCDPIDGSPPGSPVPGILQARTLEWVHTCQGIHFFVKSVKVLVTQSCPTLCDTMDCSPPGSSAHKILQTRIPEWVAIPFSRASFRSRAQTQVSCIHRDSLLSETWGKPHMLNQHWCRDTIN